MRLPTDGHPRQVDLIALMALLFMVFGSICYLTIATSDTAATTSFVEPSQAVRW
jgi:hypothetical protein